MKAKKILFLTITVAAMVSGCSKSFLETEPTEQLSTRQYRDAVRQDPSLNVATLRGLYTAMFKKGMGGTTGDDDFGQKGIDIYTDMLCSDMVLGGVNYGWYDNLAQYAATVNFTTNENYIPWRYYYRLIYGANNIIDGIMEVDPSLQNELNKSIMGQAKAMRAYSYYYLSQLYVPEYGDGSTKVLPIYTTAQGEGNHPKSTTKEVYDLAVSDLTEAIELLTGAEPRTGKEQVDVNVAKGLLSYVLAARGTPADWAQVETLTQDIIDEYPVTSRAATVLAPGQTVATNPAAGFYDSNTPSWMWGVDVTRAMGVDLVSFWGQVDYFSYSYASAGDYKNIDNGLWSAMHADDIRKLQFRSTDPQLPWNKFFDPGRKQEGQAQPFTTDLIYMRADEFYLLNAEAKARTGKDVLAVDVLSSFLENRLDDVSYLTGLSGQALLNEIYFQTRAEFWGEGKSYLAMKRNKATTTRGSNHLSFEGQSFTYNDPRLTFSIPQAEVLNNPNLNK
jgi:starch-binding outer membrane protein, SusD/RagB family